MKQTLLCCLFFFIACTIVAPSYGHTSSQHISRFSVEEGLSQASITSIAQDKHGFIWIGTLLGLNRYDGNQITAVSAGVNLSEYEIVGIFNIGQGELLVSTFLNGAYLVNIDTYEAQKIYDGKLGNNNTGTAAVTTAIAYNDNILLSIENNLYTLDRKTLKTELLVHFETNQVIRALHRIDNSILIGTTKGLYQYRMPAGKPKRLSFTDTTSEYNQDVKLLKQDPALGLLIGTVEGLHVMPIIDKKLLANKSYTLVPEKNIWGHQITPYGEFIATETGLYKVSRRNKSINKILSLAESRYLLTNPSIISLYADKNHNLWMGTYNDGTYMWPSSALRFDTLANHKDRYANNNVWSILETQQGEILIGTDNGINAFDSTSKRYKTTYLQNRESKALYGADAIYSIFTAPALGENTFVVQTSESVALFDRQQNTKKMLRYPGHSSDNQYSWGVRQYPQQRFPFITNKGFYEYHAQSNEVKALTGLNTKLTSTEAFLFLPALIADDDAYYISTAKGLAQYDSQTDTLTWLYQKPDNLMVSAVNDWAEDANGRLWLATSTEGIVAVDGSSYEVKHRIDKSTGLASNVIYSLKFDNNGVLWASSQRGLIRYDHQNKGLQTFSPTHGLPTLEFNGGAASRLSNDHLAFGTINGTVLFNPADFNTSDKVTHSVQLTQLDVLNQNTRFIAPQRIAEALDFNFDDIGIEIQFSDFDFANNDSTRFNVALSGPSAVEYNGLNRNKVFFNQLSPGRYELNISEHSLVDDHVVNSLTTRFKVAHSPWLTPYAIALYIISGLAFSGLVIARHKRKQAELTKALKAVTQASQQTKLALRSTKSGVWSANLDSRLVTQQRAYDLGYSDATITLQEHYNAIHPDDRELVEQSWKKFISNPTKAQLSLSYRLKCQDDNWHWFHDFGQVAEYNDKGEATELHGIYTNITTQKANQMQASMLGEAFSQVNDWILILDPSLQPIAVNASFCKAFQLDEDKALNELTTQRFVDAIGQRKFHSLISNLKSLGPNQYLRQEVQVNDGKDKVHPVQLSISAISKDQRTLEYFVVVVTDLTEQKQAENELRYLANFDALTQLPNRNLMLQHIEFALFNANNQQHNCALLFIDLDKFKPINDAYGHHIGDKLLIAIAKRIQSQIDDNCILARQSGDEFLLLMKTLPSVEYVSGIVSKLVKHIPERVEIEGITVSVSASVGIAVYPFDGDEPEELIRNADVAMIHAKQSGRNAYKFFTDAMNQEIRKKLRLETIMKTAVRGNEFLNHYQPIINTTTGGIAGVELLMRWYHQGELIPPNDFIPIAEESGLIEMMTEQALIRALTELRPLFNQQSDFYVSLNLSAVHILRSDIASQFSEILSVHGLSNHNLRFEITESIFMSDLAKARATINEMKRAEFVLLLDDFGTGFSSLTYLNEFPLDIIKIDQGFVRNMAAKPANKSIIRTIYLLAQSLNMKCIAEGVETDKQLAYLREVGCEYMQGYLFAKPLPAEELIALFEQKYLSHA